MVIRRQFAFSVQPDFVQHSAEIEKTAHFVVRTAELHLTLREYSLCVFPPGSSALKQISHPGTPPFPEASLPIAGAGLDARGADAQTISPVLQGGAGSSPSSRFLETIKVRGSWVFHLAISLFGALIGSMDRIVGIETEYGCLLSEEEPHVNSELWPAKVKNYLFRKADAGTIDLHYRDYEEPPGNGGFLLNGGRLYLDMGHIEDASPECLHLHDLVTYELAR